MSGENTAVAKIKRPSTAVTPLELLHEAMQRGIDAESLRELMALQREWKADQAREAFIAAMTEFKAEPLTVTKTKRVAFSGTEYRHATLAEVVDAVVSALSRHGLSHRWETTQESGLVTVSCVITHEQGHSERTTLTAPPDDSGKKNNIQQIASTVTYLQRYTLMAATGLAARDMDDDGKGAGAQEQRISDTQKAHLEKLIKDAKADRAKYLETLSIEKLEDLPAKSFKIACAALNARIKAAKEAAE